MYRIFCLIDNYIYSLEEIKSEIPYGKTNIRDGSADKKGV